MVRSALPAARRLEDGVGAQPGRQVRAHPDMVQAAATIRDKYSVADAIVIEGWDG